MPTTTYHLEGMTCGSCVARVQSALANVSGVQEVNISKEDKTAIIKSTGAITIEKLQRVLDAKYTITQDQVGNSAESTSWLATYRPILLIFFYITAATMLIQYASGAFDMMEWMRHFMAGFFLVFSFFKLLNLHGFADSYSMYDVIAKRWKSWGYLYAFIELGLGIAYLLNVSPLATNAVALIVMSVSILGVLSTVLNKQQIQCACLGDVFQLPMSTVTIIEDGLMILMSGWMLLQYL